MHVADPDLPLPDDDALIWRYLSLAKFASLLDRRELFFPRADHMADTFESSVPAADVAPMVKMVMDGMAGDGLSREAAVDHLARFETLPRGVLEGLDDEQLARRLLRYANRFLYLSCWHENETESAAMWDLYLTDPSEGVAVRTTFARLRGEVDRGSGDEMVHLGQVGYLDYATESWGEPRRFSQAFHKRRSFEHEREVRAVIVRPSPADPSDRELPPGVGVPVDPAGLMEEVIASPHASGWFVELVASLIEQHAPGVPVHRSALYDTPWEGVG